MICKKRRVFWHFKRRIFKFEFPAACCSAAQIPPIGAARDELRLFALKGVLPVRNLAFHIASLDPPYQAGSEGSRPVK